MNESSVDYEVRMVAFLDVLGWKALVDRSVEDGELRKLLRVTTEYIPQFTGGSFYRLLKATPPPTTAPSVSQFSDSIVISRSSTDSPYWLLAEVGTIQWMMLLFGFPSRGAVTVGQMYHNAASVFGPAMVKAYELERSDAIYPRVILDPDFLKFFTVGQVQALGRHHDFNLLATAPDGLTFIDFLRLMLLSGQGSNQNYTTGKIREDIFDNLRDIKDPKVWLKWWWLAEYFDLFLGESPQVTTNPLTPSIKHLKRPQP